MSSCSLMGTKVLLWWRVLFTATLHQNDKLGPWTILNRNWKQRGRFCIPFPNRDTCRSPAFYICMSNGMMHSWCVSVMGNISLELLGDCGKVSIICLGTHQCLAKKWGLMTVQQRGGERLNSSQSMSRDMIMNLQLSSVITGGTCVNSFVKGRLLVNIKKKCFLHCSG